MRTKILPLTKISLTKIWRTLSVFISCLFFLRCNAQIENCIEKFNQKWSFVKFEKVDKNKDIYQLLFTDDSLGREWGIVMTESIGKRLARLSSLELKKDATNYFMAELDLMDLAYITRSKDDEKGSARLIVVAVLFKNENEKLIDLFYFKRKKFCKYLDKGKFTINEKVFPPDKKIRIKGSNKGKRFKKNVLLIIRNGQVEEIEL